MLAERVSKSTISERPIDSTVTSIAPFPLSGLLRFLSLSAYCAGAIAYGAIIFAA